MQTCIKPVPNVANEVNPIKDSIHKRVERLLKDTRPARNLSAQQRRSIIARYTAVLEGNFITWMTATYLRSKSADTIKIIQRDLFEQIHEDHAGMLRRFAIAADSAPQAADYLSVSPSLQKLRVFIAEASAVELIVTMAFFEEFIASFKAYLAELAELQGSHEFVYTDVHGEIDMAHCEELLAALSAEQNATKECSQVTSERKMFEGVILLSELIAQVIKPAPVHRVRYG